jgi:hypothetical protein
MGSIKEESISLDSDEAVAEGLLSDEAEVEDVSALAEEVEEKEEGDDFLGEETEEISQRHRWKNMRLQMTRLVCIFRKLAECHFSTSMRRSCYVVR